MREWFKWEKSMVEEMSRQVEEVHLHRYGREKMNRYGREKIMDSIQ